MTATILTRLGLTYCTSRDIGDWIALCLLVGVGLPALCRWGCDGEQSDFFHPLIQYQDGARSLSLDLD